MMSATSTVLAVCEHDRIETEIDDVAEEWNLLAHWVEAMER